MAHKTCTFVCFGYSRVVIWSVLFAVMLIGSAAAERQSKKPKRNRFTTPKPVKSAPRIRDECETRRMQQSAERSSSSEPDGRWILYQYVRLGSDSWVDCPILTCKSQKEGFSWLKGADDIDLKDLTGIAVDERRSRVLLSNITDLHAGNYTCRVSFGDGPLSASVIVSVLQEDQYVKMIQEAGLQDSLDRQNSVDGKDTPKDLPALLSGMKPYFRSSRPLKEHSKFEKLLIRAPGELATFTCHAGPSDKEGNVRVKWMKDGKEIYQSQYSNHPKPSRFEFDIPSVTEAESGQYVCVVSNVFGAISGTFGLQVSEYSKTRDKVPKPKMLSLTRTDSGNITNPHIVLKCQVWSELPMYIEWYKLAQEVTPEERKACGALKIQDQTLINPVWSRIRRSRNYTSGIQESSLEMNVSENDADRQGAYICAVNDRQREEASRKSICIFLSGVDGGSPAPVQKGTSESTASSSSGQTVARTSRRRKLSRPTTTTTGVPAEDDYTTDSAVSGFDSNSLEGDTAERTGVPNLTSQENSTKILKSSKRHSGTSSIVIGLCAVLAVLAFLIVPLAGMCYCKRRKRLMTESRSSSTRTTITSLRRRAPVDYVVAGSRGYYANVTPPKPSSYSSAKSPQSSSPKSSLVSPRLSEQELHRPLSAYEGILDDGVENSSVYEYFKHPPSMVSAYASSAQEYAKR